MKGFHILRCKRCGYEWMPRVIGLNWKVPQTCANEKCRSPYWNKTREADK